MIHETKHTHPAPPARPAEADHPARERAGKRVLRSAVGLGVALLAVPFAAALVVFGCGGGASQQTADSGSQSVAVQPASVPGEGGPMVPAVQLGGAPEGVIAGAEEPLPPDVIATASDTAASPGESVEITARVTDDVRSVVLWDGVHDRKAFAYDSTSGLWRASYRMPLKAREERIGLSVTATGAGDRWRRVWVFLGTEQPATVSVTETPQP